MPCCRCRVCRVAPQRVTLMYARQLITITVLAVVTLWVSAFVIGIHIDNRQPYSNSVTYQYIGSKYVKIEHVRRVNTSVPVTRTTYRKPQVQCPNMKEIIGFTSNRQMNLKEELPTNLLHQLIFQEQMNEIQQAVNLGNFQIAQDRIWITSPRRDSGSLATGTTSLMTETLSPLETRCGNYLYFPGGHWKPATCTARWKVAVVVPYRNRSFQLSLFLRYMVPFLQKQLLEFGIFIVNQANDLPFNRGMLLNVGFLEALNFSHWDCFVFHDVDHLPQSEFNPYGCVDMPRHFIGGADNRNYKVPYSTSFGGVTGFTTAQFKNINGFGNVYWGWCCEDDDLERRVRHMKLIKRRYKSALGYYRAINVHHDKVKTRLGELERNNRRLLKSLHKRFKTDGLNNLQYKRPRITLHALYTNVSVDIQRLQVPS